MTIIGGAAMAAEPSSAYLSALFARTLGFPHVEFYEAFIITDVRPTEFDTLLGLVRPLCLEFPKLDTYLVRVLADPKWATEQPFDWSLGPPSRTDRAKLAEIYIAEIRPEGALTFYPYRNSPKVINIGRGWCNSK
jgi:hypothetical protein